MHRKRFSRKRGLRRSRVDDLGEEWNEERQKEVSEGDATPRRNLKRHHREEKETTKSKTVVEAGDAICC